jgi:LacI family transcriptional regulator
MAVKLGDIAKKAGVSLTTASRVINGDKYISVSKETEEKIWKYVDELGYKRNKTKAPSQGNKPKRNQRVKNIGYILTRSREEFEDTFFSKIIHGIEQELLANRHNLIFAYTATDLEDPVILNSILNSACDGLIFIGSIPISFYNIITSRIINCMQIFEMPIENPINCITVDFEKYAYLIVRKMIQMGHRNIAFIGGFGYSFTSEEVGDGLFFNHEARMQGYLKALIDNNIDINKNIIKDAGWDIEAAYKKMAEILCSGEKITAVFCSSDRMAIGAMKAIHEKGLNIPNDISMAGFDDIEIARYLNPPLTTVSYPKEEIGRIAVKYLIEYSNFTKTNDESYPRTIIFPSNIMIRDSIKKILPRNH